MMLNKRWSTSSRVHDKRIAFWLISKPEVATPPAFDALPGAYKIFAFTNVSTAPKVDGILAPSATQKQPFANKVLASASSNSFCVAQGKATSQGTAQGFCASKYSKPCSFA